MHGAGFQRIKVQLRLYNNNHSYAFAVFGPVFSKYSVSFSDGYYNYAAPKVLFFLKSGFYGKQENEWSVPAEL